MNNRDSFISKRFFHGEMKNTEIIDLVAFIQDMENNVNSTGEGYIWNDIHNLVDKGAITIFYGVENDRSFVKLELKDEQILKKSLEKTCQILEICQAAERAKEKKESEDFQS